MTQFTDVFIYTKPDCPRCNILKTKLGNAHIPYHEIQKFDENELIAEGFSTLPVLSVDGRLLNMTEANRFISEAVSL